jgi:hypothetical protein
MAGNFIVHRCGGDWVNTPDGNFNTAKVSTVISNTPLQKAHKTAAHPPLPQPANK